MSNPRIFGLGALVVCAWLTLPALCSAQTIGGGEIGRAARPGPYVPYDGAPYTQRYNYSVGPMLFFNGSPRNLAMIEEIDRMDRAERFGYTRPFPPDRKPILNRLIDRFHR